MNIRSKLKRCNVKEVKPNVFATTVDVSEHKPIDNSELNHLLKLLTIDAKTGPKNSPNFHGPSISKPKWYQFWRWHLLPRYRRELKNTYKELEEDFGPIPGKQKN